MLDTVRVDALYAKVEWLLYFVENKPNGWDEKDKEEWEKLADEVVDNFRDLLGNSEKAIDLLARCAVFYRDRNTLIRKLIEYSGISDKIHVQIYSILGAINVSEGMSKEELGSLRSELRRIYSEKGRQMITIDILSRKNFLGENRDAT